MRIRDISEQHQLWVSGSCANNVCADYHHTRADYHHTRADHDGADHDGADHDEHIGQHVWI